MNKINVIYEDNHLLVVEKPINVPVQEDESKDEDFLSILKNYIKVKYNKPGNVYLGLVHRLDRPVGGIMVFAKTSKCASRLSEQIRTKKFKKVYNAVCVGKIDDSGKLVDYLLKDRKKNIVKVDNSGKECILYYKRLNYKNNLSLVEINLETGRSHQIRVQLSNYGYPLYGDQKYGKGPSGKQIALWAYKIKFKHPVKDDIMEFESLPDGNEVYNLFKI